MASTAKMRDKATESANHAYQASLTSQDSSGTNSARPNASPHKNDPRRLRPASATTSMAGPSTTSGQAPTGGKEAYKTRPPATEMSSAHHVPNLRESVARPGPVVPFASGPLSRRRLAGLAACGGGPSSLVPRSCVQGGTAALWLAGGSPVQAAPRPFGSLTLAA